MLYRIYSDLHVFAPHEIQGLELQYLDNCVYLGDIFDARNCEKKDIQKMRACQNSHNISCKVRNLVNCRGNHDMDESNPYTFVRDGILFLHYLPEELHAWDGLVPTGISRIKKEYLKVKHTFKKGYWKPSATEISKFVALARENECHTVVFGHKHCQLTKIYSEGICLIQVPRGCTGVEI